MFQNLTMIAHHNQHHHHNHNTDNNLLDTNCQKNIGKFQYHPSWYFPKTPSFSC